MLASSGSSLDNRQDVVQTLQEGNTSDLFIPFNHNSGVLTQ